MGRYAMYLRKSRIDRELETDDEMETLSRHQTILTAVAEKQGLTIGEIYKEVVSGETISSRPEMQRLLHDVENGMWDGVLVVEIERLARGDSIDQGIVAQTFKYSNTLIVTPVKTYDPNNEFDEEYLEFGLFMSRREYKVIKRRMQMGKEQAVKEGKHVANTAPYGYRKVRLKGQKGYTLEPVPEQAEIVQKIFRWYAYGENGKVMGFGAIADRLTEMRIKTPSGMTQWQADSIKGIIENPEYIGKICWKRKPQKKIVKDGKIVLTRIRSNNWEEYDGLHQPIIDRELFEIARNKRTENKKNTCPKSKSIQNPLKGLVYCKKCGRAMQRRPYTNGYPDGLICINRHCDNVSVDLWRVEKTVIEGLKAVLGDLEVRQPTTQTNDISLNIADCTCELNAYENKIETLQKQLARAYEAYETGIYDSDTFLDRSQKIKEEIQTAQDKIRIVQQEIQRLQEIEKRKQEFIPKVKKVIDVYDDLQTAEEKNKMLREIIEKVVYFKEHRARRAEDCGNFKIEIYPKILGDFL